MTKYEINHRILGYERELADLSTQIRSTEKSIRQLQRLKQYCEDYQGEFERFRCSRREKVEKLLNVTGQDKLTGNYADAMDEILTGDQYLHASDEAAAAVFDIECEIRKQQHIMGECTEQKSRLSQDIAYWKRKLMNAEKE